MVDRQFADSELAALYDLFHPWEQRDDFRFYLPLVMSAESVLDIGCGTGALLRAAREAGYTGRLCGLDPAAGMLEQARARSDIEWVLGDLPTVAWKHEFDLVVMTGHAFQVFVDEASLQVSLGTIRSALNEDGHFIFETRNPLVREWENWTPDKVVEVTTTAGVAVRMRHEVESVVHDVVRFITTFESPGWTTPRVSQSTLRFLDVHSLSSFLSDAGLVVKEQFGDWDRQSLTEVSPEIITVAERDAGLSP